MPSIRLLLRRLVGVCVWPLALLCAAPAGAQLPTLAPPASPAAPAAPTPETPLKEISVAASAFVRGAPIPAWADLLPLPPASPTRRALAIRMDDTHLLVADKPVLLVNVAQQANDPGTLGQLGQVSMFFIPQYQRLVLHKVEILRGAEVIDHTMTAQVRFLQREAGLEQGIYSGVITASLLLPDVRVGDTLHLQYSVEGANPIFAGRYVQGVPWQRPLPVQVRRVTLIAPEGRDIHWKWNTDGPPATLAPEVSTRDGLRRTRFEERDMPAAEIEPAQPRGSFALRWLQFSEYADWADVARWADGLFPDDEPLPPELVSLVQRWLRLPTRNEQASAALQWVQNDIRYYSVSLGESSHRPHTPTEVFRNRYGDCKDKSFLLMRLLQAMGMPAHAVLASLSAPQAPGNVLASPLAFDHVVVQLQLDGRDYFLDATRLGQRGPLQRMGQGHEEARVLVVDKTTSAITVVRSPNRREIFHSELTEKFKLDAFGEDGELEVQQQFNGVPAELLRLTLARLDTQRLTRNLLSGLERRYPGISAIGTPALEDAVDLNRYTLKARFKVPRLAIANDGNWVVRFVPANLAGAVVAPPNPVRNYPLALPSFPIDVVYNAEMQWPASVSAVQEPTTARVANPAFTAEVSRSFRGNVFRLGLHFVPLEGSIAPKDVPGMLEDVKAVDRAIGGVMVVSAKQVKDGGFLGIGRKTLQDTLRLRAQSTVDRTSSVIAGGQLGGEDLAQALCLRADAQLQLGKLDEALKDAQEAVRQAPTLATAWTCQGQADWWRGDHAAAEGDYGRALVYGASAGDAYLRRGQARLYAGKLEAAVDDFTRAAQDRSDPTGKAYALLWQSVALQRLGRPLSAEATALADPAGSWPRPVLAMFTGASMPEQLVAQADGRSGDDRELSGAEAWFYVGQFQLNAKQADQARTAFEKSRGFGITSATEYPAAGFELTRMGAK